MKYWDMIKVDGKTSSPTLTSSCTDKQDDIKFINELNYSISELKSMIADMKSETGNKAFPDATLTDEEVDNVLTWLIGFHEKYFNLTPLTDTFTAKFLWNIPREVYKSASLAAVKELPDCLNPIFWFYALCLDDIDAMLPSFILSAINSITDNDEICSYIEDKTDDYKQNYLAMDIEEDEDIDDKEQNIDDDITIDIEPISNADAAKALDAALNNNNNKGE